MRPVDAVIFDMDGTVTRPILDFKKIRAQLGVPDRESIVDYLDALTGDERTRKTAMLRQWEDEAALAAQLNDGMAEVLDYLDRQGLPRGILTRNSGQSVRTTLGILGVEFDAILCRDEPPIKPHPDSARRLAGRLGVLPEHTLVVGDYLYDIEVGRAIGARTVLITNGQSPDFEAHEDFRIERMTELIPILESLAAAGAGRSEPVDVE